MSGQGPAHGYLWESKDSLQVASDRGVDDELSLPWILCSIAESNIVIAEQLTQIANDLNALKVQGFPVTT